MREEVLAVVRAAPGRDGHLAEAQFRRLLNQDPPQIHVAWEALGSADPGALPCGPQTRFPWINPGPPARGQPLQHFRTYFIA